MSWQRIVLSIAVLTTFSVQSQTTSTSDISDQTGSQKNSKEKIEKIQVTGSHIKRIDIEGVSPLENIDQDEFVNRGAIEIGDVLKDTPAFEAVYDGVGHVRFRGQHAGNVLILLNGMRMPKLNGGYYTSIRNLPTAAIGRVELLKDGGSAVYGSDAMSGVMNFIPRTDLDGGQVRMSTSASEIGEGNQTNYEATYGKTFSRGNVMAVLQYENSAGYLDKDLGSVSRRNNATNLKMSDASISGANTLRTRATCPDGSNCRTDGFVYDQVRPDNEDFSALLSGKYEFNNVDVAVLGLYNRKESVALGAPRRLNWFDDSGNGGVNNAVDVTGMAPSSYRDDVVAAANGGFVNLSGSFYEELGEVVTETTEDNYNLQTKVNGYLSNDWSWEVTGSAAFADYRDRITSGEANQNVLRQMFLNGQWNPTAPYAQKSDLSAAKITPQYRSISELYMSKAVLAGEIHNSERFGTLSMAVGVEAQRENFEFANDQSTIDGTTLSAARRNYEGSRDVQSAFLEYSYLPTDKVEMQLAGRVDKYSDVGETYNPKFGITYRPFKQALIRGSVATGFRAPGITDLYAGDEESLREFADSNCGTGNCDDEKFYNVTTYTTDETQPEEALSWSIGTVIQPAKNVTISIDQWNFEGENTLTAIYQEDYLEIERQQGQAGLDALGATINRDANGNLQDMRFRRVINLGERTLRGVDAALDADFKLSKGLTLSAGSSGMFIFERREKRFDFEAETDEPDTWKNRNYLGLRNRKHFGRLAMITVGKGLVGRVPNQVTLPQYTEYDFTYGYTASWGGQFNMTIKNLANTRPPVEDRGSSVQFANTDRAFSSFSPLRRRLFLSYNQTF